MKTEIRLGDKVENSQKMKIKRISALILEKDLKYRKKGGKLGHIRVTIPVEIREQIKLKKNQAIEWVVDSEKKTLKGKLVTIKKIKIGNFK